MMTFTFNKNHVGHCTSHLLNMNRLQVNIRQAHRWAQEMCRVYKRDGYIFQGVSYTSSGQTKGGE